MRQAKTPETPETPETPGAALLLPGAIGSFGSALELAIHSTRRYVERMPIPADFRGDVGLMRLAEGYAVQRVATRRCAEWVELVADAGDEPGGVVRRMFDRTYGANHRWGEWAVPKTAV